MCVCIPKLMCVNGSYRHKCVYIITRRIVFLEIETGTCVNLNVLDELGRLFLACTPLQ